MRVELEDREDGNIVEGELMSVTVGQDGIWFRIEDCKPPFTRMMCHMDSYKVKSVTEVALLTVDRTTGVGVSGIDGLITEALDLAGIMAKGREISLVTTKLEEAQLWLSKLKK